MKWYEKFLKPKEKHNFHVFFNAESIDCFSISYTLPEIIEKNLKENTKKMVLQNNLYLPKHFLVNCLSFSSTFDAKKFFLMFIVVAVTVRMINGREVVSF